MMTLKEWDHREDLRLGLADLLQNSEPLQKAIEVCLSEEIEATPGRIAGDDLLHSQALAGARREGYFRFARALQNLTRNPEPPKVELPAPWAGKKLHQAPTE